MLIKSNSSNVTTSHHNTRVTGYTLHACQCHPIVSSGRDRQTGHSSAASLPTGPVIAEPFISPFGFTICASLASAFLAGTLLPSSPSVHVIPFRTYSTELLPKCEVTHHTSIILKVQVNPVSPPPWLTLPNDDRRHDLLP